nr:site-specific integrase [Pararoseomonas baculiformis]
MDDRSVAQLTCPAGKKDVLVFDAAQRGFGVRVEATGRRTFLFQYSVAGRKRRMPLGVFGEVTTAKARSLAEKHRGTVVSGGDPWGEQRTAKLEAVAAERRASEQAKADAFTVSRLIEDWDRLHLVHRRASYRADAPARLRRHLPDLLEAPAVSVTRAQAVKAIDGAVNRGGPVSARRVLAYARAMFGWAQGRGMLEANPFEGLPAPGQETARERVLTAPELGLIWRAACALPAPAGLFVRFLMLTLARRDEVAGMKWGEVSGDLATWIQPGARTKNGEPHSVHLAPAAQAVLEGLERGKAEDLVFATLDGDKLTAFSFIKRQLVKRVEAERAEAAKKAGMEPPQPLPDWRMHDFRRSGVTWLADAGFPPHVADRLLNHVQGAIQGVAAIYQRAQFQAERKAALEAWAAHLVACGEGRSTSPKVVPIGSRRTSQKGG